LNFSNVKDIISKIRDNQANYQKVVICGLSQANNFTLSRDEVATLLKAKNPDSNHEISYFKSLSCPVYKILGNKGVITVTSDTVKANFKLSASQRNEIKKLCMEVRS